MRRILLLIALFTWTTSLAAQQFDPLSMDPARDPNFPPLMEELTFVSDGNRLTGLIYLANGAGPHPTVLLLHGLPGNEKNLDIAQVLRRAGFNVMFFHYRGAWGSEGEFSLLQLDEDVLTALAFLRQPENISKYRIDTENLSLLGHSIGGFISLAAGSQDDNLACVGAMSPANLGVMAAGIKVGDANSLEFLDYANDLFMLNGFDGQQMREQLESASASELDTRLFGAGLRGKSVFMVVGSEDNVAPPALMFDPVVVAYAQDDKIKLQHHTITGDHSFSWSRIQLTKLVLGWLLTDCR